MIKSLRVMVVDDHPVVLYGLINLLGKEHGIDVVAQATDGVQAEQLAIRLQPDIVLMDVCMPRQGGVETLKNIKRKLPGTKFLMISMSESDEDLFEALQAGASGYILKSEDAEGIINAVRHTAAGEAMVSPLLTTKLVKEFRQSREMESLTDTERRILYLLAEGLSNIEIADQMFVSESTVRTHISRMIDKLKLRNRSALVVYAVRKYPQAIYST